ncbi:hypothetical protein L4C38_11760 [Vibrio kasasachensis]|uniref:hypothetical protein n=1 Tax=Vibrio kasasachensis TaxID=2910248 RepID=UPI003D0E39BB
MMLAYKAFTKYLLLMLSAIVLTACTPDPQGDIPLFKQYIEQNINKSSDDPHISALVKPGDDLYEYLSKMQRGLGYRSILVPLIEQGNTEAMVWMGRGNSNQLELRGETIALLGRAMQAGDPFAALALSDGGEECWVFGQNSLSTTVANALGEEVPSDIETCSDKNWHVAQKGFKQLAAQGDLSAQYYLLRRERIDNPDETRESRDYYIKEIIRLAEGHYYKPMMDYVHSLFEKKGKSYQLTGRTPELEKMGIDLLTIAANHNYIPAITFLIEYRKDSITKNDPLFYKGESLGSAISIRWQMRMFTKKDRKTLTPSEIYYHALTYKYLTGGSDRMFDYYYEPDSLAGEDIVSIEQKAKIASQKITPMVYLDRFTLRTDWVER